MTDYRRFLAGAAPAEPQILAYFGGPFVEAADRRLRLPAGERPAAGFWRFEVRGRVAHPVAPADPPELSGYPGVRGFALGLGPGASGYLVDDAGRARRLELGPPDQPPRFAPLVARAWPTGELVFDTLDFETGVEERVREAYASRRGVREERGIPAGLRAAFGYAVLLRVAGERGVPVRPAEGRAYLAVLAGEGDPAAHRLLRRIEAARREQDSSRPLVGSADRIIRRGESERAEERAAVALREAGCALRDTRWLDGELLEVRYDCDGEQFVSIVVPGTLQVVDAGICLAGADRRLTLESLPSVLREAIRSGELHVTGW